MARMEASQGPASAAQLKRTKDSRFRRSRAMAARRRVTSSFGVSVGLDFDAAGEAPSVSSTKRHFA